MIPPKRKVNFSSNFGIPLALPNHKLINYGVRILYFDQNSELPTKRVDYEMDVQIGRISKEQNLTISFDRKNIFINKHEPDLVIEKLNDLIAQSLYPNQHIIDRAGNRINSFINHSEIIEKWEESKKTIRKKYQSVVSEDLLYANEKIILDKNRLENVFLNDIFWNHFFHAKNLNYSANLKVNTHFCYPLIPFKTPFILDGIQTINEFETDYSTILINFFAEKELSEIHRSILKLKEGKYFIGLKASFDLYPTDSFPMHMRSILKIYQKNGSEKIPVKSIHFSAFSILKYKKHQDKKTNILIAENKANQLKFKNETYWKLFKDKLNGKF
jgi:hypothetical protein